MALVVVPRVWWPLAALVAAAVAVVGHERWRDQPVRRFLTTAAAVAVVAVAYEADRLTYRLNWTCVDVVEEGAPTCGILIGQNDRGLYIGAPGSADPAAARAAPYRLVFVPADRVREASSTRRTATVIEASADARREHLPARIANIRIR